MNAIPKPLRAIFTNRVSCALLIGGVIFGAASAYSEPLTITVEQGVEMALVNNPALLQKLSDKQAAGQSSWQAFTGLLPRADLEGRYQRTDPNFFPSAAQFITNKQYSASVVARWTPLSPEVWGRMQSAAGSSTAARHAYLAGENATAHLARTSFYDALLAARLVDVADEAVKINAEELRRAKVQFDVGEAPRLNVLRAEVQLANSVPEFLRAKHNLRLAKVALANVIGYTMDETDVEGASLVLDGSLAKAPDITVPTLEALLQSAMSTHPGQRAAQASVTIASGDVTRAYSGFLPSLSTYYSYTWAHSDNTLRIFSPSTKPTESSVSFDLKGWELGANASFPLFDFFGNRAGVRSATAQKRKAEYGMDETRRAIELEVRRAYSSYLEAVESVTSQEKNVTSATEAMRLARESQSAGEATQLDVQLAQLNLQQAEALSAEAARNLIVAQSALVNAVGYKSIDEASVVGITRR